MVDSLTPPAARSPQWSTPTTGTAVIARGRPRFGNPALAALARDQGDAAAWRAAVQDSSLDQVAAATAGSFAVAITDANGCQCLAVDRFAEESLCWRVIDGQMHVDPRADVLAALAPRAEVDPQAIYDYLYFHVIPSPRTIFRGVFRLPPAHWLRFEHGAANVQPQPYWLPSFKPHRAPDFGALAGEFRRLIRAAVEDQLDGSRPACFLSGGTDSSTVAGMIKDVAGSADTYSIGFEAEGYDEMAYARLAAKRFGTTHHEYYVTPDDLVQSIPMVAAHYDQPFGNSSVLPAYHCARMAREDGITRLLAGDGGDELFGGNERYATQRVFGWYQRVPQVLRQAALEPLLERTPLGGLPLARKGRSYVQQAKVPLPDRMQRYNLLQRMGIEQIFEPDFLARVDIEDVLRQQRQVWQLPPGNPGDLNRMLAFDWRYTLAEADLPKVCGSTSLAGVAVGFPFIDQGLLDFSLILPDDFKLKGLKLRWFFKEALRGFLPDEIITKKKQGFGLPFGVWATRHERLHRFARDTLGSLAGRGIVRPAFIDTLLTQHLPSHPGYYGGMVWILMMLEQWLQQSEIGANWHR